MSSPTAATLLRVALVVVIFVPIVDRYLVSLLVPPDLRSATNLLSELALLVVGTGIGLWAWRAGRFLNALRHPVIGLLAAFAGAGLISAALNGVPPVIAVAGIGFTIEAAVLFALARMIGFDARQARLAGIGFVVMALVVASLALAQVLLAADFAGLQSFTGRFSEGHRVAAFLVNPNMLGAVLAMAIPVPLLAAVRGDGRRRLHLAAVFILTLALLYTFSRGAWLGLALATVVIGLVFEWRALALLAAVGLLAFGAALVLPRHVLDPESADVEFDLFSATVGRLESLSEGSDLRILFVENALPVIADHPVLGAGPGRYGGAVAWRFGSPLYEEYTDGSVPENRTVDNFWLHLIAEAGVLGTLCFAAALAAATWRALATARRRAGWTRVIAGAAAAMAIVIAVDSLTEMLLEGNTTAFAMWFFLGVASALSAGPAGPAGGDASVSEGRLAG